MDLAGGHRKIYPLKHLDAKKTFMYIFYHKIIVLFHVIPSSLKDDLDNLSRRKGLNIQIIPLRVIGKTTDNGYFRFGKGV